MVKIAKGTKRLTLHKKYKIEKKVKEHKKKMAKAAKSEPVRKKFRKNDNRIPNLWPFKKEILEQIEAAKAQKQAEKKNSKAKKTVEWRRQEVPAREEVTARLPIEDSMEEVS